jgi:Flp pilus assembly protein TadB
MLGAVSRKPGIIVTVAALIVAASVEAVLLWLVDKLPLWVRIILYSVPAVFIVIGLGFSWHQARVSRRRRLEATARVTRAKVTQATVTQGTVTKDRPDGPGTE